MSAISRLSTIRSSFQFKLFLTFSLLLLLLTIPLTTLYLYTEIREDWQGEAEKLQMQTEQLAEKIRLALYAENRELLEKLAFLVLKTPEVISITIAKPDGTLLVDVNRPGGSATRVISKSVAVLAPSHIGSLDSLMNGTGDDSAPPIGTVKMVRATDDLTHKTIKLTLIAVVISVIVWLTLSLLIHFLLHRLTASFNSLMNGITFLQQGDLTHRITPISNDEPGRAGAAINDLAIILQQRNEENARLMQERLDIEHKMLEAQKLESLGLMAAGVAHDFNNLLQAILGNMELAAREVPPASSPHEHISSAMTSGRQAAKLTGMMLTYLGKGCIAKKRLNLNDLIRKNSEIFGTSVSAVVSLGLALSEYPVEIVADEAQMQQIIMNLITNAAESIDKKSGFVGIKTGVRLCDRAFLADSLLNEKPEPGHYVFLEVSDNGCGMSEEIIKRLFDPFFTTKFTGRGLGMSAVLGIIRSHNGALLVESKPGEGTTFKVFFPAAEAVLPLVVVDNDKSDLSDQSDQSDQSGTPQPLALVVDDEKSVLKTCAKMVKLCGFNVITAVDGVDAVSKFREQADEIALVLMDLTMPNTDGIEAMNEIRTIRPDARVILSSGFHEDELSRHITASAPSGFIRKPYSMSEIETELQRVMQAG